MTRILRLLLIAAIALPAWLGIAATEITVCDALNTNEYVPVYGYWIDTKDVETQMIYPSSKFTGLQGGRVNQIESITFYSNAAVPAIISGATVTVRMGETNSTAFTGPGEMASNRENMVEVFSGHLASGSTTMKIDFTTPYVYRGNNIIVDIYVDAGANNCDQCFWIGESNNTETMWSWNNKIGGLAFLPKMTVSYNPVDATLTKDFGSVTVNTTSENSFTFNGAPEDNNLPSVFNVVTENGTTTITFTPTNATSYQGTIKFNGVTYTIKGIGKGGTSDGPVATRDKDFFSNIPYTWTDSLNVTHTSFLDEIATDPDQIIAMLKEVYTNKSIPGNYYRGCDVNGNFNSENDYNDGARDNNVYYGAVGTLTTGSTALTAFDDSYGWNIKPVKAPTNSSSNDGDILKGSVKYFNGSNSYTNYYLNPNQFKPDAEGVTLLLLEIVDTFTPPADNTSAATTHDYAKLRTLFANSIKSARIITEAKRTGSASDYSSGTMFKIDCDKMNKFYFIAKGQLLFHRQRESTSWYFDFPYPFYITGNNYVSGWLDNELKPSYLKQPAFLCHMFEQFSPSTSTSDTPTPTADLYQDFVGMNTFGVKHDCPNVPYVNHHFMMYGVQSSAEDCADVRDMMFFVPDYRMMNHNYRGNSTSSEPTVTSRLSDYMNYHTDHQPTLGLYIIEQDEIGKAQVSGKDVYQLTLTWRTNLHKFLPSDDQVYYLYQVEVDDNGIEQYIPLYYMNADGKYTDENDQVLADQSKPQKIKLTVAASSADKTYSKIYVPMEQSSQVLTFAVQGQDATEFLDLKMSNTQDVVIPGLDPNEMVTLTDATHYSRFNAQDVTNCYSNLIKLENNAMGLNNNNITSGTQLTLTRSYTEGTTNVEKEVATITFNPSNRQLTVTMANQSAKGLFPVGKTAVNGTKLPAGYHANKGETTWTQTYRVDNSGLIWLDRQSNNSDYRLLIYDNFVVDVKNNDHPNSYTYKLTSNYTGSITTVYLNSAEAYDASGALWYAWTWSTANDGKWVKGVSTGESHQYKFVGVKKYMKIARMNPDALDPENPSWSAEWNETGDLTVGGDNADKNTFTFTGWLYGDWSGTNPETAYSNYFRIPVFKTDTDVNNKNDRDAVDDDESGATFESEAFTFKEKVQYSSKKQILRYDAYRWGVTEDRYILDKVRANDDEDDIAPNGIAANQDGEYTVSMNEVGTSVYSTSRVTVEQGDNDKWAVFTDYYPGSEASTEGGKPFGQAFVYAPVIETFTTGMQANSTTQAREDYNTYGGPLQSFAVGKFSLSQATPEQGGVNALMSDHYWEVNGKKYSYYNIRLNVDSKSIPEGYEIYKIRAWREVDPSVLKEEFPAFQGRVKARYMFEDRTFPDYDKGESYVLGSETRTDSVTQVNLVNNQPYTSPITYTLGTFGAERVRTANDSQDDQTLRQTPIEVGFFVRIYMTRTSNLADLNTTQSQGSKAEPELPADDKYYLVEAQTSVTIEPGSVVTGLVQNLNNSREVVGVKYYNMLGIESDRPFDGVNIVVTRYSDGSTTSTKILK